jgi:ABC-type nickel/cobalt efflux system permease component RcnA
MRLIGALLLAVAALAALLLWRSGAHNLLFWWVAQAQHRLQDALAGHLQALRAGSPAAFWSLIGLCAAYGFVHALGPGHGKLLVTGAAVGSRVTAARMAAVAVAGSLAQAAVAIAVAYGALALFAATARGTVEGADRWITPVGNLAVAAIGAWLLLRGLRTLRAVRPAHGHPHDHGHGRACDHHHGPTADEVARATGPVATLALIAAMAVRPCSGALFLLVLAWRFDLAAAGAAGVVAMGLGTAAFTLFVALLAVAGRDTALFAAGNGRFGGLLASGLQIVAGGLIFGTAGALALAGASA